MQEHIFPLINGPRIKKCIFENRTPQKTGDEPIEATCNFSVSLNYVTAENALDFSLTAQMDEKTFPFMFDVVAEVQLKVPKGITEKEVAKYGILSGSPYAYATLRNFIADITRSSCLPPYYLPFLDIEEAIKIEIPPEKLTKKE